MRVNTKDVASAALIGLVSLAFVLASLEYPLGTARRMGAGYFPFVLGCVGLFMSVLILLSALGRSGTKFRFGLVPLLTVSGAIALFALLIEPIGAIPAIFAPVVAASLQFRSNWSTPGRIVLLAAGLAVTFWFLFAKILTLPLSPFERFEWL